MNAKKILLFTLAISACGTLFACASGDSGKIADPTASTSADTDDKRITIVNNQFTVNGKRIWINGANTPWNKWNDFGGGYDDSWWDNHFKALHDNGVNAVRVWINCNNDNGAIIIDDNGMVSGATDAHWNDLDAFFATAQRNGIYIMATLLSFDHFKNAVNTRPSAQKWRNMLASNDAIDSFVNNYVVPFVNRYKNNPYLWSIDMCNEPDWIFENAECGKIPWEQISNLFAYESAAIHENSGILVTVGMSFPKYNSDGAGCEGNKVSDTFLQKLCLNPDAHLDFWAPHYYDWVGQYYGVPFYTTPACWKLDGSKPALIGECMAKGSKGQTQGTENNTLITDYENAYLNGWQGVMPWTSNGVDGCGGFDDLVSATKYMAGKYGEAIFPD
ncbi:MAG: cellulase family glycosylhydrolase [Oscillospiraceae bacterium]|nr:cellulase family glycosylhydrolase [Oscillospiraceae bacterium]